jgi:hypothetical protein
VRPDVRRKGAGGHAGDELIEGLGAEVLEYSALSFFPGIVQDAGRSLPAGAVLHDAVEYPEGALDRLHGFAERYLVGRPREPAPSAATLFALDQPRAGELGQDTCQQAARDAGIGRDPRRRHLLPGPGKVDKSPQGIPPLAAELQPQDSRPPVRNYPVPGTQDT